MQNLMQNKLIIQRKMDATPSSGTPSKASGYQIQKFEQPPLSIMDKLKAGGN